jgi:F-type H+-transporting ATPase subunit b
MMTFTISLADNAWAAEEPVSGDGHTGAATEQVPHKEAFPPFDPSHFASQLLWLAITFALFYWFMNRVAIPRIAGILEVRRDRISGDLDDAQRMREESDAAYAAYEQELGEARNRAHAIGQEAHEKARAQTEAERHRVEEQLAARLAQAEARIDQIRSKAMGEVGGIASETTAAIVSELIGATVNKTEIARAVEAATAWEQGQ